MDGCWADLMGDGLRGPVRSPHSEGTADEPLCGSRGFPCGHSLISKFMHDGILTGSQRGQIVGVIGRKRIG